MKSRFLYILSVIVACTINAFAVVVIPDIGSEHISQHYTSGIYGWNSSYSMSFVGNAVNVDLRIQLSGYSAGEALRKEWEDGIEGIWSNRVSVLNESYTYPVRINLDWVTANPDHVVYVTEGTGRTNMVNWYTEYPSGWPNEYQGEIAAHEAGHMFGLYDEYLGGAVNPYTYFITNQSIMSDLGPAKDWNYEFALNWLKQKSGIDGLSLIPYSESHGQEQVAPVPEPATILLIGGGFISLLLRRFRLAGSRKGDCQA